MPSRHSIKRITGWSGFLAAALLFALAAFNLPLLLNLDAHRPVLIELLENTFHCDVEFGHLRARIFPTPGLFVSRMALVEREGKRRLLASGGMQVSFSWKTLWSGGLRFDTLRFIRPRFIAHRSVDAGGKSHWSHLALPTAQPSNGSAQVNTITVRAGSMEVWDHSTQPATRWIMDAITGDFHVAAGRGAFTAAAAFLGRGSRIDIRYQAADAFPLEVRLNQVSLAALQTAAHRSMPALNGTAEMTVKARFTPETEIQTNVNTLQLDRIPKSRFTGALTFKGNHLHAQIKNTSPTPMVATVDAELPAGFWSLKGKVTNYDAALIRQLYDQTWLNRLAGGGTINFSANSGQGIGPAMSSWSAGGRGFRLDQSPFELQDWSAQGNARTALVYVRLATQHGGAGEVVWENTAGASGALLTVSVASVTIRQMLETFDLAAKPAAIPATGWNPYAYESWVLTHADMEGVISSTGTLEIKDSDIDVAGMHIDLTGRFGLTPASRHAQIQGGIYSISLAKRIEDFSRTPSTLTGDAQAAFDLSFMLDQTWLNTLNGSLQLNAVNGVLRAFKTLYRIMSVLNLTNYFRFRMPQVTAEGIIYQTLSGRITLKNGLATTEDLFLRSPNLNIGVQGAADLLMKRIDTTLRVELFRFLEDVLKNVPITHWIFKKPTKIFLPLVVHVKGPWAEPEVL